ncbi:MAG: AMP-binding protein, partial [Verrucomicrobia bacterium]|nr:AMP-binding protein [Verrucomicrobiota bacterium]
MPQAPQPNDELSARWAGLSPKRRALAARLLQQKQRISPQEWEAVLSFGQERLWFMAQLDPLSPVYNTVTTALLPERLDASALQWAVDTLVRRHESLHTVFPTRDGMPVPVINPKLRVQVDIDGSPQEVAERPFDLAHGPLFRVNLSADQSALLICMHHIITDSWSMRVLLRELWILYSAALKGEAAELPPLALTYSDYAARQRQQLSGSCLENLLGFWRTELADLPILDLPTDRPRPAVPSFRGSCLPVQVPNEVTPALRALAQAQGATLFMVVLTAFSFLLGRYSNQDTIAIGSPVAGRTRSDLEGLIGFFVNTIVLRCDLRGQPTFRELLTRIQAMAIRAYAHQELPFEKLVEDLQPQRDLSRNPLHQVMLQVERTPTGPTPTASEIVSKKTSVFDLSFDLWDGPAGLAGRLEYSSELFDHSTISRFGKHFLAVLRSVAADPDRPIHQISWISRAEREQWETFNQTASLFPDRCVDELIEERSFESPAAPAIGGLTYQELIRKANGVAEGLLARGAGPGTLIGISLPRGEDLVIAIIGVWKTGAAYLPLDPEDPPLRRERILADASPLLVLDSLDSEPVSETGRLKNPADLAYAIYTSGSTGKPKAVLVEHRSLTNHCLGFAREISLRSSDRVLQFAAPVFDVAMEEIFPTLIAGATVVPRTQNQVPSITEFSGLLCREKITVLNLPSGFWHEWVDAL